MTGMLSRVGTAYVHRSRDDVFDSATPVTGDVMLYQAHGERFVEFISKEINGGTRPVVLLAHSLGGVACFDMLATAARRKQPEPVDLLVTVGSQAPYLYEIGASRSLLPDEPLPAGFPGWLNAFAARDFLSYRAHHIFPEAVDVEINLRQPFPRSHSSYWASDEFWAALDSEFRRRSWI
jgi:pimeloyl-ACP methyl ester carboxylesterase